MREVALSDDGRTLLCVSSGNLARLWDLGAAPRAVLDEEAMLPAIISADGDHLVVIATDGAITRHDLQKQHSTVCRGVFDTNYREPSDEDLDMYEGQMQREDIRARAKFGAINSAIVLDRSATLAQIYGKLVDLDHCKVLSQSEILSSVNGTLFSWDVEVARGSTVRVLNTGIKTIEIPGQPQVIQQIVVNGDLALVNRTGANQRGRTYAFNTRSGKLLYDVDGGNPVLSPNGSVFAVGTFPTQRPEQCPNRILTHDASTGRPLATSVEHKECFHQLIFDPYGRRLLCIWIDSLAEMLDPRTGKLIFAFGDAVTRAAFSPTGGRIATTNKETNEIKIWDVERGRLLATLIGHVAPVQQLVFSSDGNTLVSVGRHPQTDLTEVLRWDVSLEDRSLETLGQLIDRGLPRLTPGIVSREARSAR